ncbi:MAG: TMEM175 family protein [Bacteroidota bacterium]
MKHNSNQVNEKETGRVEAFSDGVFAIAITLLVLELIEILHTQKGLPLTHFLSEHWHSFFAFTIGFITILVCWINHHTAFEYLKKVDTNFMWVNGFLLFLVTLVPFPTAILAEYLDTESMVALSIYGLNFFLISIAAYWICAYAYNHQLVKEEHREKYYFFKKLYGYSIIYTGVAFSLCFVSTIIPIILYFILFSVFAAPKKFTTLLSKRKKLSKKSDIESKEDV